MTNSKVKIVFEDFRSDVPQPEQKKTTAADVAVAVIDALTTKGKSEKTAFHPEYANELITKAKNTILSARRATKSSDAPHTITVSGVVNDISTTTEYKEDKKLKGYSTVVSMSFHFVVDGNPDKTYDKIFKGTGTSYFYNVSVNESVSYAINELTAYLKRYMNNFMPICGRITELTEFNKKGVLKKVCIDVGSNWGITYSHNFIVYVKDAQTGKSNRIGRIRVSDFKGEDMSFCRIKEGAEEIVKALNEGKDVYVESNED